MARMNHMIGLGQQRTLGPGETAPAATHPEPEPDVHTRCFTPLFPFVGTRLAYRDYEKDDEAIYGPKPCRPIFLSGSGSFDFGTPIIRFAITGLLAFWLLKGLK